MPDGECCDMAGCLELFLAIDKKVRRVDTYSRGKPDTYYVRKSGGKWKAMP